MKDSPCIFNSIPELHRSLGLPEPQHPLISLVNYANLKAEDSAGNRSVILQSFNKIFKRKASLPPMEFR